MSATACAQFPTKPATVGRRRSAGTAEEAESFPEMAVSEPGGSPAVSAMPGRGGLVVSCGLTAHQWLDAYCSL